MINLPTPEQASRAKSPQLWDFGNNILYKMCKENFYHKQYEHILAKVLFIGRIYAAAVERRRNKNDEINDNFYIDTIAPTFRNSELDSLLKVLQEFKNLVVEIIQPILQTHFYLTTILNKITDLNKRSFSSKYLHFHLPNLFFIYDSRAVKGLRYFTSDVPNDLRQLVRIDTVDKEYAKFFCKCFDLKRQTERFYKITLTNRQFDNILVENANIKNSNKKKQHINKQIK